MPLHSWGGWDIPASYVANTEQHDQDFKVLHWLPNFPDLNPTETLWAQLVGPVLAPFWLQIPDLIVTACQADVLCI